MSSFLILLIVCFIVLVLILIGCVLFIERIKKQNMEVLETLVCVLEAGDPNMDGHSLHVHYLTMLLYDYLPSGMKRQINRGNLNYASLLFDIGRYGVPGRILNKTGKLGSADWEIMKRHPEICVRIMEQAGDFDAIRDWMLYHHERMDGSGYYGLKGEEIPLASRMIALADTFSSITMTRSYKPTLTYEDATAELRLVAGSQLDPVLVEIFEQIPMNKVEECLERVKKKISAFAAELL